jgi:HEAT repeat protein
MQHEFWLTRVGYRAGAAAAVLSFTLLGCSNALAQTPDNQDRARSLLENSLKDKNPETRTHAVQSLGLVSAGEPYLSELEAMIADKDVGVRLAAIASLVDLKSDRTTPALGKALDSDVPEVSFAAAKALWTLGDASGREALFSVLGGETKSASGFITKEKRDALRNDAHAEDFLPLRNG